MHFFRKYSVVVVALDIFFFYARRWLNKHFFSLVFSWKDVRKETRYRCNFLLPSLPLLLFLAAALPAWQHFLWSRSQFTSSTFLDLYKRGWLWRRGCTEAAVHHVNDGLLLYRGGDVGGRRRPLGIGLWLHAESQPEGTARASFSVFPFLLEENPLLCDPSRKWIPISWPRWDDFHHQACTLLKIHAAAQILSSWNFRVKFSLKLKLYPAEWSRPHERAWLPLSSWSWNRSDFGFSTMMTYTIIMNRYSWFYEESEIVWLTKYFPCILILVTRFKINQFPVSPMKVCSAVLIYESIRYILERVDGGFPLKIWTNI
jgi:hypothetical protein